MGIVAGFLVVCAWIGWAIHVGSAHGARQALGVLIVWPAIALVLGIIAIPFVWAFRVIRTSARSDESELEAEPESAEAEATETG